MRVLIVEDDRVLARVWREVLEEAGHDVVVVSDAENARKRILTAAFDTVVLDLMLGQDSGLSVAALGTYANPDCQVIVVTGSQLFARGELFALAPNISAVLRKPVSIHDLVAVTEHNGSRSVRMTARA